MERRGGYLPVCAGFGSGRPKGRRSSGGPRRESTTTRIYRMRCFARTWTAACCSIHPR